MKICFFDDEPEIYPLQYGGKARTITNLSKEFIKLPEIESVSILSRTIKSDKTEFIKDGIKYKVLNDENMIKTIADEMRESDIMNIHCCSYTFPMIKSHAKKFYFLHDVLLATAEKGSHLDKSLGGDFDAVIAPSEFAKNVYDENRKILGGKIECQVIPRHINSELFYQMEIREIKNDKNTPQVINEIINKYEYIFFFPSRPIEEKGGGYLLDLCNELDKSISNYCIIGPFGDNNTLPSKCIDTGWINSKDLKYYYSISNVTLNFSSLPESFSQICIESAYCGTPVVSFKSGNIPYLSEKINTIILVNKDSKSILKGIKEAIHIKKNVNNTELVKKTIQTEFGVDKVINEYLSLYKKYMED